jgi:hypothetical protein
LDHTGKDATMTADRIALRNLLEKRDLLEKGSESPSGDSVK